MYRSINRFLLFLIILTFASVGSAQSSKQNQPSFTKWVQHLKKQAFARGISTSTIDEVFSDVRYILKDESLDQRLSTGQFISETLSNNRVLFNRRLVSHYSDILFEIKHLFDVNPETIIALWGIDKQNTQSRNGYSAFSILSSLSYREPNNNEIKKELFQALRIIDDGQINTKQLKSDINGNLGTTHFTPSTFRDYAVDYDGDGDYDLWHNHADIFASTANYLSSIGWKSGQPWGIEVKLPHDFSTNLIGSNQQRSIRNWQKLGLRLTDGSDLPLSTNMASIIYPDEDADNTFLVFENYYALLRWKRSQQFAFAVGMMMDQIKQTDQVSPMTPFADVSE